MIMTREDEYINHQRRAHKWNYIKADRIQMNDDLRGRSEFMISLMITA